MRPLVVVLSATVLLAACGSDDPSEAPAGSGGTGATAGTGGSAAIGGAAGTGGGTAGAGGGSAGSADVPAPDAASVNAFLQTRAYRQWPGETKDHASAGPHGGTVKVYLNPTLDASFAAGNASHPVGSISVKEFYQDGKPSGFAYSAKLDADSAGGDGWYWYEVFTDAPATTAPFAGKGVGLCKNCHAGGGRDFVLTTYPLQ